MSDKSILTSVIVIFIVVIVSIAEITRWINRERNKHE